MSDRAFAPTEVIVAPLSMVTSPSSVNVPMLLAIENEYGFAAVGVDAHAPLALVMVLLTPLLSV